MRILILNHYAGSDLYGMEFRPLYLGRELVKLGNEVTVIAADYSHLRVQNPVIEKSFSDEWIDGVRYVFLKTIKYDHNNLKRFFNMMSYLYKLNVNAEWICKKYQPDVIIASSTYPYDVKAAKKIASFGNHIKVCYEIHDIWPLSLIELYNLNPKNPYIASLQRAENYAYQNADMVISILPHVDRHIKELGFKNVKYIHIPNGIVTDEVSFQPAPKTAVQAISLLKENGKFILMYLGGFAKANAIDDLITAADTMPKNVQIVLVGDGPLKSEYEHRLAQLKIENITILDSVKKLQVNNTLSLADALYIGAKKSNLYTYGVGMNKIFDYMLSKKPIIYAIESSNNPIAEAQCGVTAEAENPVSISNAVKQLASMTQDELLTLGENGYHYVKENNDYQKLAVRFADSLHTLCDDEFHHGGNICS